MIGKQCLALLKTIGKLDQDGILYATTIAKVFGFQKVSNYQGLVSMFFREKEKYLTYYRHEPEENRIPKT